MTTSSKSSGTGNLACYGAVCGPGKSHTGCYSDWLVSAGVTDLIEGAFDELLTLLANIMINGGHRLDRAGSRPGEGELAIDDLALIQRERAVAEDDEAAVSELAGFVFMEIEDDFFIGKVIFGDFHRYFRGNGFGLMVTKFAPAGNGSKGYYESVGRQLKLGLGFVQP